MAKISIYCPAHYAYSYRRTFTFVYTISYHELNCELSDTPHKRTVLRRPSPTKDRRCVALVELSAVAQPGALSVCLPILEYPQSRSFCSIAIQMSLSRTPSKKGCSPPENPAAISEGAMQNGGLICRDDCCQGSEAARFQTPVNTTEPQLIFEK